MCKLRLLHSCFVGVFDSSNFEVLFLFIVSVPHSSSSNHFFLFLFSQKTSFNSASIHPLLFFSLLCPFFQHFWPCFLKNIIDTWSLIHIMIFFSSFNLKSLPDVAGTHLVICSVSVKWQRIDSVWIKSNDRFQIKRRNLNRVGYMEWTGFFVIIQKSTVSHWTSSSCRRLQCSSDLWFKGLNLSHGCLCPPSSAFITQPAVIAG